MQLFKPHRWEQLFYVCTSCLQLGRLPFNPVVKDGYRSKKGGRPRPSSTEHSSKILEVLDGDLLAFDKLVYLVRSSGARTSEASLRLELSELEKAGVLETARMNQTERLLQDLRAAKLYNRCPVEDTPTYISLYMQFREAVRTMKKVGGYCTGCKHFEFQPELITELVA